MQYFIRLICILMLLLSGEGVMAQYDNVWAFGKYGGLDFNNGSPQAVQTAINPGVARRNPASICDGQGALLFYSDGNYVWDKNHNLMPGGINLTNAPVLPILTSNAGSLFTSDATAIAMKPGSSNQYYIFSERREPIDPNQPGGTYYPSRLYYSLVDMALNNGLGEVIAHGIAVDTNVGSLTMVTGEDCNIWLVAHEADGFAYKAYEITAEGISGPVISLSGYASDRDATSALVVSPDRHRLAFTNYGIYEISDFDPLTGIVSNITLMPWITTPALVPPGYLVDPHLSFHAAFSPDSKKLYGGSMVPPMSYKFYIVQFDLTTSPYTATWLGQIMGSNNTPIGMVHMGKGGMKLGPDGKIYFYYVRSEPNGTPFVTYFDTDSCIGVINQPDITGSGCDVSLVPALYIPPITFSEFNDTYFSNEIGIVKITDTLTSQQTTCFRDSLRLWAADTSGYGYQWQDGDVNYQRTIRMDGLYVLRYYTHNPCTYHHDSFLVQKADFDFTLGPDTTICGAPPFALKPFVPGASYYWPGGITSSSFEADSSGTYWVRVSRNGCNLFDSIQLHFIDLKQDLGDDVVLCVGDPLAINLNARVPVGATISWNTGSVADNILVKDTGTYWLMVNQSPCVESDSISINYDPFCDCSISMPTAFSPNGDGMNDIFRPVITPNCPVRAYLMSIYNRWGQLVYTGTQPQTGWDGMIKGAPADVGTYMYSIKFKGGRRTKDYFRKGDLTLMR